MPSEHSDPRRGPAWPEVPPAWPEVPPPAASYPPNPVAGPHGRPEPAPFGGPPAPTPGGSFPPSPVAARHDPRHERPEHQTGPQSPPIPQASFQEHPPFPVPPPPPPPVSPFGPADDYPAFGAAPAQARTASPAPDFPPVRAGSGPVFPPPMNPPGFPEPQAARQPARTDTGPGFPELPPEEGPWASAPNVFPRAEERNPSFPPRPVEPASQQSFSYQEPATTFGTPRGPFDPRVPPPPMDQQPFPPVQAAQAAAPATDRTVTMGPPGQPAPPQAAPQAAPQAPPQAMPPAQPQPQGYGGPTTGEHLVQQLPGDDPYKPFVTAGQISGPKTPPAARQQELWETVWGDGQHTTDDDDDDEKGKPVWLFALVGSVLVALIVALLWAFLAGPLSSAAETTAQPAPSAKPSATKPAAAAASGGIPEYDGEKSAVKGTLTDEAAGISISQLGGQWKTDADTQTVMSTYGYSTRQYVSAGLTSKGKPWFATVMTGKLPADLASQYKSPTDLRPVLNGVVFKARQTIFPKPNKVARVGAQKLPGGLGQAAAYKVTDDGGGTLVVVAAVNTGAEVPSIVYMMVPDLRDDLLPDVNTILKSIKKT
ncbi:hypothetical protein [Herbidospora cretacea]|uniref:hypothetical protein n=1 Tax=Herbidospora cretacea TaxID=28444 RepID=UPI0012DE1642|nr:hypothetical protein [Herbidospora cretacea]